MLLARLRIRGKLALLLIAPLLGMVALTVPVVLGRIEVADRAADTVRDVRLANEVGSLVQDLQQERLLTVGHLLLQVEANDLIKQSATVSDRVADLRSREEPLPSSVRTALEKLVPIGEQRGAVLDAGAKLRSGVAPGQDDMNAYRAMPAFDDAILALLNALPLVQRADTATSAGRQLMALDALLRTDEATGKVASQIAFVAGLMYQAEATGKVADPQDQRQIGLLITSTLAGLLTHNERFQQFATAEQRTLYLLVQEGADNRVRTDNFLAQFAIDPVAALSATDLPELFPTIVSLTSLGRFIEKKIVADVIDEVSGQEDRALTEAYVAAALCLLVLLFVVLLSVAVARAIARPLTRLTRSAESIAHVAEAELTKIADGELDQSGPMPVALDPVDVRASDEVGDLARAFERVQGTAARLVERQVVSRQNVAQMFGHVGRRTQNLVGRQLALIDRLERQETDTTRLQHLYRLDHISSRLRRSASSLVVLSGSPGADNHVAPLPLADVVRLALGEIEDYTRVDIRVPSDIAIAPAVIGDIVLALAELMENATTFSPPHTRVTVTAVVTDPGVRLLVVDRGLGMSPERLADENARLARRERLDLVPTEVLGLFVVGRLARRHGLRVKLTTTPGGGVTAEIEVPERLLVLATDEPRVVAVARARVSPTPELPGPMPTVPGPPITADVEHVGPAVGTPAAHRAGAHTAATAAAPAPATQEAAPPPLDVPVVNGNTPAPADAPEWPMRRRVPGAAAEAAGVVAPGPVEQDGTEQPERAPEREPEREPEPQREPEPVDGTDTDTDDVRAPMDDPAFSRANRLLQNGQTWNAFVPYPREAPGMETDEPKAGLGNLRQRVPGAQLPTRGSVRRTPAPPGPADPVEARALIEQFEAGVQHAERQVRAADPVPTSPAPAGAPNGGLRRRQPGATLDGAATAVEPPNEEPLDADEARDLVQQFESGVAKALRQISAGIRDEEGSTR